MTVWDKLAVGAYENSHPYPVRPKKPQLGIQALAADYRAYADALEIHGRDMAEWSTAKLAWETRSSELENQFREDLEAHYGMSNHPKRGLLYEKAYYRGHSGGLHEIACVYWDLLDLVK